MDLGGRLDVKDELGLSSRVADGPFTEMKKLGRGSGWRGNPKFSWGLNEEAVPRKLVCFTQGRSKVCDRAGSRTPVTKYSRAGT